MRRSGSRLQRAVTRSFRMSGKLTSVTRGAPTAASVLSRRSGGGVSAPLDSAERRRLIATVAPSGSTPPGHRAPRDPRRRAMPQLLIAPPGAFPASARRHTPRPRGNGSTTTCTGNSAPEAPPADADLARLPEYLFLMCARPLTTCSRCVHLSGRLRLPPTVTSSPSGARLGRPDACRWSRSGRGSPTWWPGRAPKRSRLTGSRRPRFPPRGRRRSSIGWSSHADTPPPRGADRRDIAAMISRSAPRRLPIGGCHFLSDGAGGLVKTLERRDPPYGLRPRFVGRTDYRRSPASTRRWRGATSPPALSLALFSPRTSAPTAP